MGGGRGRGDGCEEDEAEREGGGRRVSSEQRKERKSRFFLATRKPSPSSPK